MASDASLHELVAAGLFRDAAVRIDKLSEVPTNLRVLRAQLEIHVGRPHSASDTARELLKSSLTNRERSHCWEILGRVALSVGQVQDGLRAMARAFEAATEAGDLQAEARLRASYVHALLQWVGTEAAAVEIPKLRQVAVRAGDGPALIALHTLVAEISARKGLVKSALASIEVSQDLLSRFENAWQRGRLSIVSAGVSLLQADYDSALERNEVALGCADRSGSREIRIPALGNLAFIKLAQHKLADVQTYLQELNEELARGGVSIAEIGVRDIEMQLAIAADDATSAAETERRLSRLMEDTEGRDSYYGLWQLLTRVKWLYRLGKASEGVTIAMDAIPRIARMSDRSLLERMKLIAAEGHGRLGNAAEGSALLATVFADNPDTSLEIVAEVYRVAGRLAAPQDPGAASRYFDQATRIFEGIGYLAGVANVRSDVLEMMGAVTGAGGRLDMSQTRSGTPATSPSASESSFAASTGQVSVLVETGNHPPLLAREARALFAASQATLAVKIVTTKTGQQSKVVRGDAGGESQTSARPEEIRISVGTHRENHFELVVTPVPSAAARATVLTIERLIHNALALAKARQTAREQASLWTEKTPEQQLGLICVSEKMLELIKTLRRVADSNVTVLLTGETGVGKELFARALHQASTRSDRIFLPFNCATVPRDMFDSQLFGHRRGSFTGAHEDSPGVIRAAAGGTLFLDEIGEMSLDAQPKLLRFLESGEIMALGEQKPRLVDVRVVAATNAHLDQLVSEGKFREDLFYRLDVIRIEIPPLRERREEIPSLVSHFLERFGREQQKPLLRISDETLEYLVLYKWPGNVRQLANEIRRIVALAEPGSVVMPAHLSQGIASSRRTIPVDAPPRQSTEVVTRIDQPLAAAVEHIERAAIQRAIAIAEGQLDEAAKILGLSRKGLYLKRQRLKIE
jgi:transcriptional regulator with PAS, ATPase and Fis domain